MVLEFLHSLKRKFRWVLSYKRGKLDKKGWLLVFWVLGFPGAQSLEYTDCPSVHLSPVSVACATTDLRAGQSKAALGFASATRNATVLGVCRLTD